MGDSMCPRDQSNGNPYGPPAAAEVMRAALAEFAAKTPDEQTAILKAIGILDENGDVAPPEYRQERRPPAPRQA